MSHWLPPLSPSLPPCVDAAHVRHRQIVAYKKCIAWDDEPGQTGPGQASQLHAQSNRIDGNFFSFAKVLRRMCHMDRSRNSSPALPVPALSTSVVASIFAKANNNRANLVSFVHF